MSSRPVTLNDQPLVAKRIRKDQFRRIQGIIDANIKFPLIALGLVRDYCKGIEEVAAITFDNSINPENIIVYTKTQDSIGGTEYYFGLKSTFLIETPTL
jgi:hypothetical protein